MSRGYLNKCLLTIEVQQLFRGKNSQLLCVLIFKKTLRKYGILTSHNNSLFGNIITSPYYPINIWQIYSL